MLLKEKDKIYVVFLINFFFVVYNKTEINIFTHALNINYIFLISTDTVSVFMLKKYLCLFWNFFLKI